MKYLTVCMNFRNESAYLKEWIDFHLSVGVDHFILYDNKSTDNFKKVLSPYILKKQVTLLECNDRRVKLFTYPNTINKFKNHSKWIAFIDCDEFLVPEEGSLKDQLVKFEGFAGVQVASKFFGSNGHVKKPKGGVLENFTKRRDDSNNKRILTKSIVNPSLTKAVCCSPHYFNFKEDYLAVDTNKNKITERYRNSRVAISKPLYGSIHLNHYWSRSYEEFAEKHSKPNDSTGRQSRVGNMKDVFDNYNKSANAIDDRHILKFLQKRGNK